MRGTTLVEIAVVLVVLGVMAGVSALAVTSLRLPPGMQRAHALERSRAAAIRTGHAVTVTGEDGAALRFLPDGRALGIGVDPLTGEVLRVAR